MASPLMRMALGKVEVNPDLIAELISDKLFTDATLDAVDQAVDAAKAIAPVDDGDYRDSITSEIVGEGTTVARLTSDDYKAHWIEWGSVHNAPQAPLRRGILAAGLSFKESRG